MNAPALRVTGASMERSTPLPHTMDTNTTDTPEAAPDYIGTATYCPEDNKLRLYVGRVPRPDFERLRAMGWTCTPKQSCDFVAHWTPERRDLALEWCGEIGDEDQDPAERAADRAERFGGYRDKREGEATGRADRYDAGPVAHGFQSQARAERSAARHNRIADRACDAWSKAEYWTRRTAGVISHALHVSSPSVRMGRIKELEADIRRVEKSRNEYTARRDAWLACAAMTDTEAQDKAAARLAYFEHGDFVHPRTGRKTYLYAHCKDDTENNPDPLNGAELCALWLAENGPLGAEGDWLTHYRLRLAYENQMLEAQGGRAAFVEMEPGGWLGSHQIRKVFKSNATGRVVSVELKAPSRYSDDGKEKLHKINVERMDAQAYRPPTDEDRAALAATLKAEKAARPEKDPCPLINPTDADAERLVTLWNERRRAEFDKAHGASAKYYEFKPCTVERVTQAVYSANSKGAHARAEARDLHADAFIKDHMHGESFRYMDDRAKRYGKPLCKIRSAGFDSVRVIILTDKPQKPLPAAVWVKPIVAAVLNASESLA